MLLDELEAVEKLLSKEITLDIPGNPSNKRLALTKTGADLEGDDPDTQDLSYFIVSRLAVETLTCLYSFVPIVAKDSSRFDRYRWQSSDLKMSIRTVLR
ncbi:uncharacterized protein PHALS_14018 [Plasmopara halstedii]|uniref:Uncharacterized protein n=1 Tax=Plasmopara halstedii TaxID=4781 RepID=A0A0P1AQZ8_PLAHL|nr:uncharacterized protein PHALS_14018 [Plasmopara halstedii]CEG43724.1 hypothetical protein PHALS_14018 [Plasmopara halstedii]|eukprot:XP_024580093.1 hypothetical protein PHALS_14018 [Plasmopara halstedii]